MMSYCVPAISSTVIGGGGSESEFTLLFHWGLLLHGVGRRSGACIFTTLAVGPSIDDDLVILRIVRCVVSGGSDCGGVIIFCTSNSSFGNFRIGSLGEFVEVARGCGEQAGAETS